MAWPSCKTMWPNQWPQLHCPQQEDLNKSESETASLSSQRYRLEQKCIHHTQTSNGEGSTHSMTSYLSTWSTKRAIRGHGHRVQVPSRANVVSLQFATLWWGCQCSRQTGSVVGGESVNVPPYTSFVFKRFLQDLGPDVWRMYIHKMMLSNFMGRVCIWQTHKIMCTSLHLGYCRFSKEFAIQCQGRIQ